MSAPGLPEIVVLIVLAVLIFGPDKLPGFARSLGKTVGQLKREANAAVTELKRSADLGELREVRDELRSTAGQLQEQATAVTAGDKPRGRDRAPAPAPAVAPPGPAPFDPDAT